MASPVTLRLDQETRRRIARIARQRRVSASQVIREAIEALVNRHETTASPYEAMADLIGVVRGGNPKRSTQTGRQLATLLAGRRVKRGSGVDAERRLINVVDEMAIASGLAAPPVYVLPREKGINAFAAGRSPNQAIVVVTRGALEQLNDEELEGVIAHEMSHIGNFDIRFALLVGVLVGSIALLADWFLRFSFWGGGRRDNDRGGGGGAGAILFIVALLLAIIAPLIGRLVQLAVSRRREALADVSAVELTRNPLGLARALRTISEDKEVLEVANRATQHLYIVNPIKSFEERSKSMWDTHPPLGERIAVLRNLAGQFGQDPNAIQ
jgi:heat shock protein HtpX